MHSPYPSLGSVAVGISSMMSKEAPGPGRLGKGTASAHKKQRFTALVLHDDASGTPRGTPGYLVQMRGGSGRDSLQLYKIAPRNREINPSAPLAFGSDRQRNVEPPSRLRLFAPPPPRSLTTRRCDFMTGRVRESEGVRGAPASGRRLSLSLSLQRR
eukprot:3822260-Rhodomonas_salina.1